MAGLINGTEVRYQNTAPVINQIRCDVCGQMTRLQDLLSHQIRKKCVESKLKHDVVCAVKDLAREARLHQRDIDFQHQQLTRHFRRSMTSLCSQSNRVRPLSTSTEEYSRCRNCNKAFKKSQNNSTACRWHIGPVVNIFGGSCSACGRLDYQHGCVVSYHEI